MNLRNDNNNMVMIKYESYGKSRFSHLIIIYKLLKLKNRRNKFYLLLTQINIYNLGCDFYFIFSFN